MFVMSILHWELSYDALLQIFKITKHLTMIPQGPHTIMYLKCFFQQHRNQLIYNDGYFGKKLMLFRNTCPTLIRIMHDWIGLLLRKKDKSNLTLEIMVKTKKSLKVVEEYTKLSYEMLMLLFIMLDSLLMMTLWLVQTFPVYLKKIKKVY